MKASIHPEYHADATITCASCNSVLTTGSTVQAMRIEVCSNCHPFYTGRQNLVDTAGRVDRYQRIVTKRTTLATRRSPRKRKSSAA